MFYMRKNWYNTYGENCWKNGRATLELASIESPHTSDEVRLPYVFGYFWIEFTSTLNNDD